MRGFEGNIKDLSDSCNRKRVADYITKLSPGGNAILLLTIVWIVGFVVGIFLLKFVFVKVAVQASLAYNTIIGRNIHGKYQQVDVIPDLVKTLADSNIYQRYSLDPLRVVKYPAFYRKGFKFFDGDQYKYAICYEGNGNYTVYRKVRAEISGNKTKTVVKEKSKIKV